MPRQLVRSKIRDEMSRRELIGSCVAGAVTLPLAAVLGGQESKGMSAVRRRGAASRVLEWTRIRSSQQISMRLASK